MRVRTYPYDSLDVPTVTAEDHDQATPSVILPMKKKRKLNDSGSYLQVRRHDATYHLNPFNRMNSRRRMIPASSNPGLAHKMEPKDMRLKPSSPLLWNAYYSNTL